MANMSKAVSSSEAVAIGQRMVAVLSKRGSSGLGLGWILGIAIGGGVVIFVAIGFLLVWRVKARSTPCTTRVYAADAPEVSDTEGGMSGSVGPLTPSTTVLSKRWLRSESSFGGKPSTSHLSVPETGTAVQWQPPVLPPLPTHNTGQTFGSNAGTLVDESDDGGRGASRSPTKKARRSWFGRDSWAAMMSGSSTLNTTTDLEMGEAKGSGSGHMTESGTGTTVTSSSNAKVEHVKVPKEAHKPNVLKKRGSNPAFIMSSQTAPALTSIEKQEPQAAEDAQNRGRSRIPGYIRKQQQQQEKQRQLREQQQLLQEQQQQKQQQASPIDDQDDDDDYPPEDPVRVQEEYKEEMERRRKWYEARIKASTTESDLRDILELTDKRLREGSGTLPVKNPSTPQGSPDRAGGSGSPTKTPRSARTSVSYKTPGRMTPSPSKMNLQTLLQQSVTPTNNNNKSTHSKTPSNATPGSVGSGTTSLIREAAESLRDESPSRSARNSRNLDASPLQRQPPPQMNLQHLQQQQQQQPRQAQPARRRSPSLDSEDDESSFLSTLYSVSDRDEEEQQHRMQQHDDDDDDTFKTPLTSMADHDPFVEARNEHQHNWLAGKPTWERRQLVNGPRPQVRRMNTVAAPGFDTTAMPAPLRTMSTNPRVNRSATTAGANDNNKPSRLSMVLLHPPEKTLSEDVKPKSNNYTLDVVGRRASLPLVPSAMSVTSESAYTDITVSDTSNGSDETLKNDDDHDDDTGGVHLPAFSSAMTMATPTKNNRAATDTDDDSLSSSSSPLDENQVLSMLMDGNSPKRELPKLPSAIILNDDLVLPTPLSPRPKGKQQQKHGEEMQMQLEEQENVMPRIRRASVDSVSSSSYDNGSEAAFNKLDEGSVPDFSDLVARRATAPALHPTSDNSVGNTIAELRRMNSVLSSYSATSMTSTVFGDSGQLNESPTLPTLRGGGFSPEQAQSSKSGTRAYLNVGSPKKNKKRSGSGSGTAPNLVASSGSSMLSFTAGRGIRKDAGQPRTRLRKQPPRSAIPVMADRVDEVDEDAEQGKENESPTRAARTVRFALGRVGGSPSGSPKSIGSPRGAIPGCDSVDSLGLYDKDGFLKTSPEREAIVRSSRLRM